MAESHWQTSSIPAERIDVLHEATGEPFRYPPISPNSVRFLNLHPSPDGNDTLSCTFLCLAPSHRTGYEILSGYWGDLSPFQPVSILVDSRSCKTTPQLAQALCKFRHRNKPRLIWIQSLCIDPQSTPERNTQIARLREILQSAQRLIVWLGGAEDGSDAVFEHLSQFRHIVTEHNWPPTPRSDPVYGRRELPYRPAPEATAAADYVHPYPPKAAAGFTKLCFRPWFYRPWSLPELALSQNILLVCGDHQLQQVPWWNPIAMLVNAHQASHGWLTTPSRKSIFADLDVPPVDPISHVSSLAFHPKSPVSYPFQTPGFENAYRIVRNCRATDRRDSVFAIATLDAVPPVPPVRIDYYLSVSHVYQQATFALLQRHKPWIQVLRRLASPSRDPDIPSWTLDFSAPLETAGALWALSGARFLDDDQPYFRSVEQADPAQRRPLWPYCTRVPRPRVESGKLFITGRFMENIAAIGPIMPPPADGEIDRNVLMVWEQLASQLQTEGKRFPQSIADAFFDTILANDTHDALHNDPPRPLVSHVAGRARRWYKSHGAGILREVDLAYFAGDAWQSADGSGYASGNLDQVFKVIATEGEDEVALVARRIARTCRNKRFFISKQGSLGLAPAQAGEGDVIVFLPRGLFPFFLRPLSNNGEETTYRLIGEGFLYDWWGPYMAPVWEHRVRTMSYGDLLTDFVVE